MDWFERLFGLSPDGGSGALEWGIVALVAIVAVGLSPPVHRALWACMSNLRGATRGRSTGGRGHVVSLPTAESESETS
jgi:hypothetical protein